MLRPRSDNIKKITKQGILKNNIFHSHYNFISDHFGIYILKKTLKKNNQLGTIWGTEKGGELFKLVKKYDMLIVFFKGIQGQYMGQKKEKTILSLLKSKIQIFIYIYIKLDKVLEKELFGKNMKNEENM